MNSVFLILLSLLGASFSLTASSLESKPCDLKVKIEGEFSYKKRLKKSKKIEIIKERGDLKATWEGNDQAFENLFLKGLDFDSVRLSKIQNTKVAIAEEYLAKRSGDELSIEKLNFSKLVLGIPKPFKLKFEFIKNKQTVCHKEILILEGD
jgi:hypothetical protein